MKTRLGAVLVTTLLVVVVPAARAQTIVQSRGSDPLVDYASLVRFGPWDDRNYQLDASDLALLAANEAELSEPVPAFYRVRLRRANPAMPDEGPCQYPRSALPRFLIEYGGYLVDGRLYRNACRFGDRWVVDLAADSTEEALGEGDAKALDGDVRVTSPVGGAESAVAIKPGDPNRVIAGSVGPGIAQKMWYSANGGSSWSAAAALPYGSTCCDPAVAFSVDGSKAYTTTLTNLYTGSGVFFYRSGDNGQTWTDLETETPGDARREFGVNASDKEYLHVDGHAASPYRDNLYVTWHENNVMKLARSTDLGNTWSSPVSVSSGSSQLGIGSDVVTGPDGAVYYLWPAYNSQTIWVRRSNDGGASFAPVVSVATTQASYDFPVPSMDSRNVFVYVSAAADLSSGPYAGRIYAAWTDSTAPTGGTPANNHARIQVARSSDGGATWQVATPHETADATTVDRWHEWIAVGPDGTLHVVFYDTRNVPTRTSVELFWSYSTDGGATFSTPVALTSAASPSIEDTFEFGDYNGLDVVQDQLVAIFTDNRNESGGGADSVDVYAAGGVLWLFADGFESGTADAWSAAVP